MAGLAGSARWSWRVSMVFRTKRAKVLAVASVAGVAAALTVGLSAPSGATPTASQGGGRDHVRLDRVFIIVLENHSAKSVIGDPNTPYIRSLAQQYGEAANYYGVTHPSEPNYIAMTSGSTGTPTTTNRRRVRPHQHGRRAGGRPHQLGRVHGRAATQSARGLLAVKRPPAVRVQAQPVRAVHRRPGQPGPGGAHQALYRPGQRPERPSRAALRVHSTGPVQRHARRGVQRDPRSPGDTVPVRQRK